MFNNIKWKCIICHLLVMMYLFNVIKYLNYIYTNKLHKHLFCLTIFWNLFAFIFIQLNKYTMNINICIYAICAYVNK